jgi:hypothetical protein
VDQIVLAPAKYDEMEVLAEGEFQAVCTFAEVGER